MLFDTLRKYLADNLNDGLLPCVYFLCCSWFKLWYVPNQCCHILIFFTYAKSIFIFQENASIIFHQQFSWECSCFWSKFLRGHALYCSNGGSAEVWGIGRFCQHVHIVESTCTVLYLGPTSYTQCFCSHGVIIYTGLYTPFFPQSF